MYLAYYCLKRVYCTASYKPTIFRPCIYSVDCAVCYSEHVHKCLAKLKVSNIYFVKDFNATPYTFSYETAVLYNLLYLSCNIKTKTFPEAH